VGIDGCVEAAGETIRIPDKLNGLVSAQHAR
jgi:hypothetical protein